jgi:transcription initiation factor TFIIB
MSSTKFTTYTGSSEQAQLAARTQRADENAPEQVAVEHDPSARSTCPEFETRLITEDHESFCEACDFVVSTEPLDRGPTLADLGRGKDGTERCLETENAFRDGKSLGSTFYHSDINTCGVSGERDRELRRMLKAHQRHSYDGNRSRSKRLDDIFYDVQLLQGELALPEYVAKDAAQWMRQAKDARLPGGHMAWESLAAGAMLLAAHADGWPRPPREIAQYSKTSHERLCAAARKIRIELELDAPPVRTELVQAVLDAVDDDLLDGDAYLRLATVGRHLLDLADDEQIAPGTSRLSAAAAAVYAADQLTDEKWLTRQEVVEAGSTIVETSTGKVGRYAGQMYDAYVDRHGIDDPSVVLDRDEFRVA